MPVSLSNKKTPDNACWVRTTRDIIVRDLLNHAVFSNI